MKGIKVLGACLLCLTFLWSCQSSGTQEIGAPQVDTIHISGMQFHPSKLTVNKRDTVVWINEGIVKHNVTAYPDSAWTSGKIATGGDSWKKVITDSFPYFCSIHPTMKGKILLKNTQ